MVGAACMVELALERLREIGMLGSMGVFDLFTVTCCIWA
jgi:hypothetical protein